jgi:hypothetical protein
MARRPLRLKSKAKAAANRSPSLAAFARQFKPQRQLLVGGQGISLEEFLSKPAAHWLE